MNSENMNNSHTIHLRIKNFSPHFFSHARAESLIYYIDGHPLRLDAQKSGRKKKKPTGLSFFLYVLAKQDEQLRAVA